jgi:hypothetical protein
MDKTTAQSIVRDTFKAPFDRKRYRDFISEVCNGFDESKKSSMLVPDAFAPHVKSCQRLGTFASPEGEVADILIVQLTERYKLERTRTALRDFVAHKLKRDESYKEAGLVAFVAPDSQSWRFSYVRMEYETKRDPKTGKIKAEERLTPARRYSYLVGVDEECHTAQSRFLPLLQNTSARPTLGQIEEAFSVEAVTKEFFNRYYGLFQALKRAVENIVSKDKIVRDEFRARDIRTDDFAKKLLGQIVFLYFIQKKGWLGVQRGQDWGSGPRNFLRQLASGDQGGKFKNFFRDVLETLFYDTLATNRSDEAWCPRFKSRIPFLNGGLFEPLRDYDWKKLKLTLSNELFFNTEKGDEGDIGTGVLDVFDRYNFTVNEAEPLEQEVAIDPEMLGKVFENLLEAEARKSFGTFYTPREIVHYMCQETLTSYLHRAVNIHTVPMVTPKLVQGGLFGQSKPIQEVLATQAIDEIVSRDDLAALVQLGDQAAHYETALKAGTTSYGKKARPRLPKSIEENAKAIDTALRDLAVCDPAVGSGAFPVGMMTEIIRARLALNPYFDDSPERSAYHFKRHAIHSSLYGVDIDSGAVEIAKLRLWLSLVVDEEDPTEIKPLPNLDFKIVTGNSLLGFPFKSQGLTEIETLKIEYFDEPDHDRKARLKEQIDRQIQTSLAQSQRSLGYQVDFDYRLFFSEVFRAKGGFDVVIANPPYIDSEAMTKVNPEVRDAVQSTYKYTKGNWDIYIAFFETGFNNLNSNGVLSFITPDKWISKPFGDELRKHTTVFLESILHAGREVFETAKVDAIVTVYSHSQPSLVVVRNFDGRSVQDRRKAPKADLSPPYAYDWLFSQNIDLLAKLRSRCGRLSEIGTCENACATSDAYKLKEYVEESSPEYDPHRFFQIVNTGTIGKYISRWGMREMVYLGERFLRPVVDKERFLEAFHNSYGSKAGKPKIIVKGLNLLDACLDKEGQVIPGKTTLMVTAPSLLRLKVLAAILNNPLSLFYLKERYPASSYNQGTTFTKDMLNKLPVPVLSTEEMEVIARAVDKVIKERTQAPTMPLSESEKTLNAMIFGLYGLTEAEIDVVSSGGQ